MLKFDQTLPNLTRSGHVSYSCYNIIILIRINQFGMKYLKVMKIAMLIRQIGPCILGQEIWCWL